MRSPLSFFLLLSVVTMGLGSSSLLAQPTPPMADGELPEGVEQILPRGHIAAVFEPDFVPAEAAEIPDHAWVLGVVIDGQPRAYSLNLLNRHEVVNDRVGERPIAAVW